MPMMRLSAPALRDVPKKLGELRRVLDAAKESESNPRTRAFAVMNDSVVPDHAIDAAHKLFEATWGTTAETEAEALSLLRQVIADADNRVKGGAPSEAIVASLPVAALEAITGDFYGAPARPAQPAHPHPHHPAAADSLQQRTPMTVAAPAPAPAHPTHRPHPHTPPPQANPTPAWALKWSRPSRRPSTSTF